MFYIPNCTAAEGQCRAGYSIKAAYFRLLHIGHKAEKIGETERAENIHYNSVSNKEGISKGHTEHHKYFPHNNSPFIYVKNTFSKVFYHIHCPVSIFTNIDFYAINIPEGDSVEKTKRNTYAYFFALRRLFNRELRKKRS